MQWSEEGLIIGVRRHGETSLIVETMRAGHGRHLGLVRGGRSGKLRATLQPGNWVQLNWRARLEEHLGIFSIELLRPRAADLMIDRDRLYMGQLLFSHLRLLPERDPHPRLLDFTLEIIDSSAGFCSRVQMLALFELALLDELGFGLDLTACAVSGQGRGLSHVSPRTGRAVTAFAAGKFVDRLFPLPGFFLNSQAATAGQVLEGLEITGHFLQRHIWDARGISPPMQREQILNLLRDNFSAQRL